jgi:hypothetical protein
MMSLLGFAAAALPREGALAVVCKTKYEKKVVNKKTVTTAEKKVECS